MIGQSILHYKILEKLGEGGMGEVYLAEDTELDRKVALKFLPLFYSKDPEVNARFKREAKATAALNHPNIITIFEIGEFEDRAYIAMEYVDGKSLKDKIADKELSFASIVDLVIQVCEGLQEAHKAGIVHRDIKPDNILLDSAGRAKILDFGLAQKRGATKLTKEASTLGTLNYMSPEQCQTGDVDQRTDIWSLGVVLYEMITGKTPFQGEYETAILYSIMNEEPEPLARYKSGVSMELERIVNKCLQKDPSSRYQHVDELLVDLKVLVETEKSGISKTQVSTVGKSWLTRMPRQKQTFLYGGIATLLLLAAIAWVLTRSSSSDEANPVANSGSPSIAVMYFENRSSEEDLDKILVDMLTTNLARYEELDVVSSQRLFDILKNMGKLNIGTIDRTVATEVANKANVNTMLMGSIIQIGNKLRVTSQLTNVKTGNIIASEQVEGEKIEDIFAMVDELTEKISNKLIVSTREPTEQPLRITDATTANYRAYKFYQRGQEYYWRFDFANAAKNYERAIDIDSTFAKAHLKLGVMKYTFHPYNHYADMTPVRKRMALAEKYSKKASQKEQLYIAAVKAIYDRQHDKSIALFSDFVKQYPNEKGGWEWLAVLILFELPDFHWEDRRLDQDMEKIKKVLELDPAYANAQNFLAYILSGNYRHTEAIAAAKKYIALQPDVLNTYDTAWEIYMMAGELDSAMAVCEEALKINSNWRRFYRFEGYVHLFQGDGEAARARLRQAAADKNPADDALVLRNAGYFDLYEGRYNESLKTLRKAVQTAGAAKDSSQARDAMIHTGKMLTVMNRFDEAFAAFEEAKEFSKNLYQTKVTPVDVIAEYWAGVIYLKKGDYQKAQTQTEIIRAMVDKNKLDELFLDYGYLLQAEIQLANGDAQSALESAERVGGYSQNLPRLAQIRASALSQVERTEAAANVLRKAKNNLVSRNPSQSGGDYFDYFYLRSQANYLFGRFYEQGGDIPRAIEYYTKAVEQWKNADASHVELMDAKTRLMKLEEAQ